MATPRQSVITALRVCGLLVRLAGCALMPTADGNLVLACSGVNRIALVVVTRR